MLYGFAIAALVIFSAGKSSGKFYRIRYPEDGKAILTVNGKSYTNGKCLFGYDTLYRHPTAAIPLVSIIVGTGTDSIGFTFYNMPDKSTWSSAFTSGDSTIVDINNNDVITYKNYVTGLYMRQHGQDFPTLSLTNKGGKITKTGPRSFTFSCTTHPAGKHTTDYTISGSGTY